MGHLDDLFHAYRHTSFFVDGPTGRFVIRVDHASVVLDELLARHGQSTWAYVTAYNPQSQLLSTDENKRRQQLLCNDVTPGGYTSYAGEGVGDDPTWCEPSLLILGITEPHAIALGRHYGQAAVVVGSARQPARLLDLATDR